MGKMNEGVPFLEILMMIREVFLYLRINTEKGRKENRNRLLSFYRTIFFIFVIEYQTDRIWIMVKVLSHANVSTIENL